MYMVSLLQVLCSCEIINLSVVITSLKWKYSLKFTPQTSGGECAEHRKENASELISL